MRLSRFPAQGATVHHGYGITDSFAEGTAHAKQLLADGTVAEWLRTHEEADYSA